MAQYTPSSGDYCRPHRTPWGAFNARSFQLVSSIVVSTVMPLGRYVALLGGTSTSAGQLIPAAALGSAAVLGVGILAENGVPNPVGSSAVAGKTVPVWEANPMQEFKAISKGAAVGSSHIGLRRSLAWDSTLNVQYVDLTASTASEWRIIVTEILPAATGHVEGDSGCYVAFKFLSHLTENVGSSVALTSTTPILAFYS